MSSVEVIQGRGERGPIVSSAVLVSSLVVLVLTVFTNFRILETSLVVAAVATAAVAYRVLLSWKSLLAAILVVILVVPIRRYHLPASLPINLELYRLLVALVFLGWLTSLLIDPRVKLRGSPLDRPLALILCSVAASIIVNPGNVNATSSYVLKSVSFLLSYVVLFYLIVSVTKNMELIHFLVKLLVVGGCVLAVFALVERQTDYNVFNHLAGFIPLLRFNGAVGTESLIRGVRLRVYGSSESPIAYGALFALLVPLGMYLARVTGQRRWWLAQVLFCVAALATTSRTAVVMLLVVAIVFLCLKPRETRRLWPAVLPLLATVHILVPGTIGTLKASFFPQGGLVAEQSRVIQGNQLRSNGRIADISPTLHQVSHKPLFGRGFGTRVVGFDEKFNNAAILDDQWLGTLLEVGVVGAIGWIWLFFRVIRRLGRSAKADPTGGWLQAALAASLTAFAIGMFTYDALGFIQVTFVFFFLLALAAAFLRLERLKADGAAAPLGPSAA